VKNIGIIGCGYWGAKHARVVSELPTARLHSVADLDPAKVAAVTEKYADVQGLTDFGQLLAESEIDGVVIATPASTHFPLALRALEAGKHVMVETPITVYPEQAQRLIEIAAARRLTLMVGHTFEYHPAVEALREIVQSGELGDLYYLDLARVNLGLYQRDVNVIHDLSPHDISIMLYVLGQRPVEVATRGYSMVHGEMVDVAHIEYRFANGLVANSRVSWLAPRKAREMTIVGSKKMVVYDDVAERDPVMVFDKGIVPPRETGHFSEWKFAYQYGDSRAVPLASGEPLKRELSHFVECLTTGQRPKTDGVNGRTVVSILHAAQLSWQNGGRPEPVDYLDAPAAFEVRRTTWRAGALARRPSRAPMPTTALSAG
jgi:predicted dehydrogenase